MLDWGVINYLYCGNPTFPVSTFIATMDSGSTESNGIETGLEVGKEQGLWHEKKKHLYLGLCH